MIAAVSNSLYVAWRYLLYHRVRTVVLIVALAIIVFVPVLIEMVVRESRDQLTARAEATPMVLGAPGSALDLVMNSLYFTRERPDPISLADASAIDETGLARTIPLYTRFRAGERTIIGTWPEYFELRGLKVSAGRPLAFLGEAVLGARAAAAFGVVAGGSVLSSPENLFDLAGQYALKMPVVGVLAPSGTADDDAVFVDLRTTWIIEGLGHGHEDLTAPSDPTVVLERQAGSVVANAKLKTYTVMTPETLESFHFHGDASGFPITAAIAVPTDARAGTILLGRYQSEDRGAQLVRPNLVIEDLIATIFRIRGVLDAVVLTVAFATVLTVLLVFLLSLRLRAKELVTITRLGCSRSAISGFVAAEVFIIAVASAAVAGGLLLLARGYSDVLISRLLS